MFFIRNITFNEFNLFSQTQAFFLTQLLPGNVLSVPYMFDDQAQLLNYLNSDTGKGLMNSVSEMGITTVGSWTRSFRKVTNSKRPVNTPEDIKGLDEEISFVCTDEGATEVKLAGVYTAGYQSYDYYPGTYQMDFYRLNDATNQMEVASQEIQLVKDEDGKSYWLKGLEYDILVTYDKPRGGLSILPQFLKKVQGGYVYLAMWDLMNDYVLRSSAIGLISYPTTDIRTEPHA